MTEPKQANQTRLPPPEEWADLCEMADLEGWERDPLFPYDADASPAVPRTTTPGDQSHATP